MAGPEDCTLSLDGLFFEGPVTREAKPQCQGQGPWQLEPPPLASEIPGTQELQQELETLRSYSSSQTIRKFVPPLKKTDGTKNISAQRSDFQKAIGPFSLLGKEDSHLDRDENSDVPQTQRSDQLFGEKTSNNGESSQLRRSLFKCPQTASASDRQHCPSVVRRGALSNGFNDGVTKVSQEAFMTSADNSQSSMRGPCALGGCASTAAKQSRKTAHVLPLTPQPLNVRGGLGMESGVLRAVTEIPAQYRSVFKEFPYFNYIQSKALDDLLYTGKNFVACAPTGSGKTVLFELVIIRLLMEEQAPWSHIKIVYMAPIKALCSQRYENWKQKFGPLGLNCKELTGDTEIDDFFEIQDAHLIMTTPEKWDSMTRKWSGNCLVQLVRLFLIDEVHVVKDETRGATLEVVVSRMKAMCSSLSHGAQTPESKTSVRFVAVSATIPNIKDIADWLSDGGEPAVCLEMDEEHRPVKLRKVVLGFPCSSNQTEFKFDLSLNYKIASVIQTYSDQKPTLVFCATRKGVQQSASVLAKDARFIMSIEHKQRLMKYADAIHDSKLRDLVMYGIGFHHAGIDLSDRKLIEGAFTMGDLPVLFTTSTLAMGVNLPAHLVVIKSTMHYVGGMFQEYSETDILQMIGRAGRPQFDTTATAVIMTRSQTKDRYTHLVSGDETTESSLHKHLVEHLNAEIVLHTFSDVNGALDWIRSTFLYIRALKNPSYYGFPPALNKAGIEAKLQELCLRNLNALSSVGLITMDEDINFKTTETGKIMARYCIAYDTMKQFTLVSGTETLSDLIRLISKGKEFSDVQLRVSEKRTLNTLNKDKNRVTIRYPIEGKIKTNEMKVNCLIQAQLGCIAVQEFGLTQDMGKIFRNGTRVTKCLSEVLGHQAKRNFSALLNSLILAKCFRSRLWENSPFVSKQLEKIGLTLSTAMVNAGLTSFQKIEEINARELELIVNRHPPFGNQIREAVIHLPKYEVSLEQVPKYSVSTAEVIITVILTNYKQLLLKRTAPDNHYVSLLIGDSDNQVLFHQKLTDSLLLRSGSWSKKTEITRAHGEEQICVNLISSEYVGLDIQQTYSVFYSGPKRFRAHVNSWESQQQHSVPATAETLDLTASAQPVPDRGSSKEIICRDPGIRQCNHYCKNKEQCGHDCCKVGVVVVQRSVKNPESIFSSYLSDLKSRTESLAETPVKRLKMKMSNDTGAVDLHRFSYKQNDGMPTGSRRCERNQNFMPTKVEALESFDSFTTSQQRGEQQCCESDYDTGCYTANFHSWIVPEPDEELLSQNTEEAKNANFSVWKQSDTGSKVNTPQNNTGYSENQRVRDADESGCFSEAMRVTFDLGVDDWSDIDDENLVQVSELFDAQIPRPGLKKATGFSASLYSNIGQTTSLKECKGTTYNYIIPQVSKCTPALTCTSDDKSSQSRSFSDAKPKIHTEQSENRMVLSCPRQNVTNTSAVLGKFDFFSQLHAASTVSEGSGRFEREDSATEVSAFLGIFDGIF